MSLLLLVLGVAGMGFAWSEWLWRKSDLDPSGLERICAGGTLAFVVWIGLNWVLSAAQALTSPTLITASALFLLGSLTYLGRTGRLRLRPPRLGARSWLLLPLIAWTLFSAWRGTIMSVQNNDANCYHMLKAASYAQSAGYHFIDSEDQRVSGLPCNYELLVSDILILDRSDRFTASLSAAIYLLCLAATGLALQRWWGPGRHALAGTLLFGGMPVLLLGVGQQKNDLLTYFFMLLAFVWVAAGSGRGRAAYLLLAILASACALGTKPQAALLVLVLLPFSIWQIWTRPPQAGRGRSLTALLLTCLGATVLLGGSVYLVNVAKTGNLLGARMLEEPLVNPLSMAGYGDWQNLYLYPVTAVLAPICRSDWNYVSFPWDLRPWYWPKYEFFFSEYGLWFSAVALLFPFGLLFAGRQNDQPRARERWTCLGLVTVVLVLTLPVRMAPYGILGCFQRYTLWVVPVVLAWGLSPWLEYLDRHRRGRHLVLVLLWTLSGCAAVTAWQCAQRDAVGNLDFLAWRLSHPGDRAPLADLRASCICDALAGPDDTVAIEPGPGDTWSYPAFGPNLRRRVIILPHTVGRLDIPEQARWVVIDRAYQTYWNAAGFHHINQFNELYCKGEARPDDLRLLNQLSQDPRFERVKAAMAPLNYLFRRR